MQVRDWTEETVLRMNLPMEALLGSALVQICSDKEAVIENHRGLVEYSDRLIGIASVGRTISIRGQGLRVASMSSFRIRITGHIDSVAFL